MRSFFGLSQSYIKNVYEQFFYMKYYAGWSIFELYSLPIGLRNFYVEMFVDLKEKQKEAQEEQFLLPQINFIPLILLHHRKVFKIKTIYFYGR